LRRHRQRLADLELKRRFQHVCPVFVSLPSEPEVSFHGKNETPDGDILAQSLKSFPRYTSRTC
jgi:hypothetical protein